MSYHSPTAGPDSSWPTTKRKLQAQWGILPSSHVDEPDWSKLAADAKQRVTRVGSHLMDTVREVAREAGMTFSEATTLLQSEGEEASVKARQLGQQARKSLDAAKLSLEDLTAALREGLSEGVEKSKQDPNATKSFAEGVGMAAGSFLNALIGGSKKP